MKASLTGLPFRKDYPPHESAEDLPQLNDSVKNLRGQTKPASRTIALVREEKQVSQFDAPAAQTAADHWRHYHVQTNSRTFVAYDGV
jgi:hypothetical protein